MQNVFAVKKEPEKAASTPQRSFLLSGFPLASADNSALLMRIVAHDREKPRPEWTPHVSSPTASPTRPRSSGLQSPDGTTSPSRSRVSSTTNAVGNGSQVPPTSHDDGTWIGGKRWAKGYACLQHLLTRLLKCSRASCKCSPVLCQMLPGVIERLADAIANALRCFAMRRGCLANAPRRYVKCSPELSQMLPRQIDVLPEHLQKRWCRCERWPSVITTGHSRLCTAPNPLKMTPGSI